MFYEYLVGASRFMVGALHQLPLPLYGAVLKFSGMLRYTDW